MYTTNIYKYRHRHTHTHQGIIIEGQGAISGYQRQHMFIPDHLTSFAAGTTCFFMEAGTPTKSQRTPGTTVPASRCTKWLFLVIFLGEHQEMNHPTNQTTNVGMFKHPMLGYVMLTHAKVISSFQKAGQLRYIFHSFSENHYPNVWKHLLHTLTATAAQWPLFSSCALFLQLWQAITKDVSCEQLARIHPWFLFHISLLYIML